MLKDQGYVPHPNWKSTQSSECHQQAMLAQKWFILDRYNLLKEVPT